MIAGVTQNSVYSIQPESVSWHVEQEETFKDILMYNIYRAITRNFWPNGQFTCSIGDTLIELQSKWSLGNTLLSPCAYLPRLEL